MTKPLSSDLRQRLVWAVDGGMTLRIAARTVDDLWDAIAQGVEAFTPNECRNFFTAAGYEPE
jgi:hypothetical protein